MDEKVLIAFFKSGRFCESFGHLNETKDVYDDCKRVRCKFCGKEDWS